VRKGDLSQEIINEANEQLKLDASRQVIQKKFDVGDLVNHLIWKHGKVIKVNEDKGEYQIEFIETGKTKPINFEFRGLTKIEKPTELTEEEKVEKSKSDDDWNSFVENEIQINESKKTRITETKETSTEEKEDLIRKRIGDLKVEKSELDKVAVESSESELIPEPEEEILSPTTYKNNGRNPTETKDSNKNKLWSKLKKLWS